MPKLLLCLLVVLVAAVPGVRAEIIAESGFNDGFGLQSNQDRDSPYVIGEPLQGQRAESELGWVAPWAHEAMTAEVQGEVVYEGDGALAHGPGFNAAARAWHREALAGTVGVQWAVRFEGDARASFALGDGANVSAHWMADEGGRFLVFDGRLGEEAAFEPTGFTWQPGRWHIVSLISNDDTRAWRLFVDGELYRPEISLGWRSMQAPPFAQSSVWLDAEGGRQYVDAVSVFVPDVIMLTGTAEGGSVCTVMRLDVSRRLPEVCTDTEPGQSASEVLRQLGASIEAHPAYAENGVHPFYSEGVMFVASDIESVVVDDAGLTRLADQTGVRGRGMLIAVFLLATGIGVVLYRARAAKST